MRGWERVLIGCLGGLAAVCVKFLGQDYFFLVQNFTKLTPDQVLGFEVGYLILTPVLIFLGGLIAWASEENGRLKLLAIAVSAPALITTWAGGVKDNQKIALSLPFISSAYASTETPQNDSAVNKIVDGVGIFFGYGREIKKYWVVIGSHKDRSKAQAQVESVNTEDPSLGAFVGLQNGQGYWPVIAGPPVAVDEGRSRMEKAKKLRSVNDTFLSKL